MQFDGLVCTGCWLPEPRLRGRRHSSATEPATTWQPVHQSSYLYVLVLVSTVERSLISTISATEPASEFILVLVLLLACTVEFDIKQHVRTHMREISSASGCPGHGSGLEFILGSAWKFGIRVEGI